VKNISFDGTQYMYVPLLEPQNSDGEDITLRFRTAMSSGLLFVTTSNTSKDSLMISMTRLGGIKLSIDIGCTQPNCTQSRGGTTSLVAGNDYNDDKWHVVTLQRRGQQIILQVDAGLNERKQLPSTHKSLQYDAVHIGRIYPSVLRNNKFIPQKVKDQGPFIGLLQNLDFNKLRLADDCLSGVDQNCKFNCTAAQSGRVIGFPVSFENSDSFIKLKNTIVNGGNDDFLVSFYFRTIETQGLLVYAGKNNDFLFIELALGGKLRYVFSSDFLIQDIEFTTKAKVNDQKWHRVKISRYSDTHHSFSVDGNTMIQLSRKRDTRLILQSRLESALYIAGVPRNLYYGDSLPNKVSSLSGFQGCMGSVDINSRTVNLMDYVNIKVGQSNVQVIKDCRGPANDCAADYCKNNGQCIQHWGQQVCDCSKTYYQGAFCESHLNKMRDGVNFKFGPKPGLVLFTYKNQKSERQDSMRVGFATTQNNATLVRILGAPLGTQPRDWMKLSLENGKVTLTYNMGTVSDVVLREPVSVADGTFHEVIVRRNFLNATLEVDNYPTREVQQQGKLLSVFNSQSTIEVGGIMLDASSQENQYRKRRASRPDTPIVDAFVGQMGNLVFNKVQVFEQAKAGDDRISVYGDVEMIQDEVSTDSPATTTATLTTITTTRSTIVAPAGPGCDSVSMCDPKDDIISSSSDPGAKDSNVGQPSSFVTAMISGVAAAVVCCVLILLFVVYRYRKNDLFGQGKPSSSKPPTENHQSSKKDKKSSSSPPIENGNCGGLTIGGVIGGPGSPGIMTGDIRITPGAGNVNNGVTKQHPNAKINGIIGMHQNRTLSKEKEYFV